MTLEAPSPVRHREDREKFFLDLYEKAFPPVATFVSKMGGTFQDAGDIFQDALIILYEKIAGGNQEPILCESAYVLGIAKHLWIRKFNHDRERISLDGMESEITIEESPSIEREEDALIRFLELTGKKCLELLKAFYYDKLPMKAVARMFGYSTVRSATVQKYKCLEKVRDQVKEKSVTYESFLE